MPTLAVWSGTSRTATYLIPNALEAGYKVRAIVRSTSRFYHKVDKHDRLSALELHDVNEIETLREHLDGADTVVITMGLPFDEPTTILQDAVQSCVAAIRLIIKDGGKQPKILLLSSSSLAPTLDYTGKSTNPDATKADLVRRFIRYQVFNYEYDDLERAQLYLEKQSSWLDYSVVMPGGLVDVPEPEEELRKWKFSTTKIPDGFISYQRLAAAMMGLIDGGMSEGKNVMPIPTTEVKMGFKDLESLRANMVQYLKVSVLLPALKGGTLVGIGLFAGLAIARSR
ncbi:hypothetical protein LTS18_013077 [Coniosporium uncinatum]|uniref:Uncharacterized protein n=1 Tax=Coniosporium uncinatum TaxID=93489 RepID=A0ACC3DZL1_9PEZI|nr:hypothetical protein LTS18_013077 [Coniosporium uncinatum]